MWAKSLELPGKVRLGLKRFSAELCRKYGDAEVYLFGSYARGDWLNDSDVDVIVVSKAFENYGFTERIKQVRMLAPKNIGFEILAYTPEEFKAKASTSVVIQDASQYWLRVD